MKKAVVTGGSGGIGSAICRALAENGYYVYVGYASSAEKAELLAAEIGGEPLKLDVSCAESTYSTEEYPRHQNHNSNKQRQSKVCDNVIQHPTIVVGTHIVGMRREDNHTRRHSLHQRLTIVGTLQHGGKLFVHNIRCKEIKWCVQLADVCVGLMGKRIYHIKHLYAHVRKMKERYKRHHSRQDNGAALVFFGNFHKIIVFNKLSL